MSPIPADPAQRQRTMIFAAPRSGSTWLGKILDSHPLIHYLHEPEIAHAPGVDQFPDITPSTLSQMTADLKNWSHARDVRTTGTRPVFAKARENILHFNLRRAQIYAFKGMERLIPGMAFAGPIIQPSSRTSPHQLIKTVNMLGRAGLCLNADPKLKAIFLVRHPCGQVASMLRGIAKYGKRHELTYSAILHSPLGQREGLSEERFKAMDALEILAWKWAAFNDAAFAALESHERAKIIHYEAMTIHPHREIAAILDHMGLPPADQVKRFIDSTITDEKVSSHYKLQRDPQAAAARWKSEFSSNSIETIRDICCTTPIGQRFFTDDAPLTASAPADMMKAHTVHGH
ncbi:hypothetical protein JCM17846_25290 [Iodidimonas nitroreducens]|uniref:Sulfotransferase n=1 Tax=Iodidimonas nitroreducens TaxID=1236968 RepID=A0A5A7NA94_9PROT|nr:sulfotransferase [Iodidimonas nitroreducens]GAK32243.1 sulfotransferase domain protein [alpha proteobacterium Q-1]GER04847.1 hypothetical protein JCM17846_25290 [Iodidimonas nitroreducens]